MKNTIIIQVMQPKKHRVLITPFSWIIVPTWSFKWASGHSGKVRIQAGFDKAEQEKMGIKETPTIIVHRKYANILIIRWLCLSIQIGVWRNSEAASIFPSNWNHLKHTPQENEKKYTELLMSGYFS